MSPVAIKSQRLPSIDVLRGLVMIIMLLGHIRLFGMNLPYRPEDIEIASPALFFTRWFGHFSAPVFVALAGLSTALVIQSGKSTKNVALILLCRGIWLILLEILVVNFVWTFELGNLIYLQIIWVIGAGMIIMSAFVYLSKSLIWFFALLILLGHNLSDMLPVNFFDSGLALYNVLRGTGPIDWFATELYVEYPVLPWFAVMLLGYLAGDLYRLDATRRSTWLFVIGFLLILGFLFLRIFNGYGDPAPWSLQMEPVRGLMSFLNAEKYPPSIIYVLMTLGPALVVLAVLERIDSKLLKPLIHFGSVPLFFYLSHLYLAHGLVVLIGAYFADTWRYHPVQGLSLPGIYLLWILTLAMLYPLCFYYGRIKHSRRYKILSFL